MDWLAPVVLRITNLGPWAPVVFVLVYIAAALTMAPAFFLTMAAGALFGVWQGSVVVFAGASLGASAVYAVASPLARSPWMARLTRNPRMAVVRAAIVGEGAWVMFLLRLSPLIPFTPLNYALALSGVRYRDYLVALLGMIPAILIYTYYGKVVGDVAALASGVSPPRGPAYYALAAASLVAIAVTTALISRAARRALVRQPPSP
jgi:uncharacterized membrane protein YdjX (TVP38/TMEM64 family)